MMQKLILPIQKALITAGYQNTAYRNKFGFSHYGMDLISVVQERQVCAGGSGTVLLTGLDSTLGNVLIVVYPQVYNHQTGATADLVLRYYHLDSVAVKAGDAVLCGATLGRYGNTGRYSAGAHLHIEADYDVKNFAYSATVGRSGTMIKAGTVQTMCHPANVLHIKATSPEGQSCLGSNASFGGRLFVLEGDRPTPL